VVTPDQVERLDPREQPEVAVLKDSPELAGMRGHQAPPDQVELLVLQEQPEVVVVKVCRELVVTPDHPERPVLQERLVEVVAKDYRE